MPTASTPLASTTPASVSDVQNQIAITNPTDVNAVSNLGDTVSNTLLNNPSVTDTAAQQMVEQYLAVLTQSANSATLDPNSAQTLMTALATVVNTNTSNLLSSEAVNSAIDSINRLLDPALVTSDSQLSAIGTVMDGLIDSQLNSTDTAIAEALRQVVQNALLTTLTQTNAPVTFESESFTAYAASGQPQNVLAGTGIDVPLTVVTANGTDITNSNVVVSVTQWEPGRFPGESRLVRLCV